MPLTSKARESLTDRQAWLYDFLEDSARAFPTRWIPVSHIIGACSACYDGPDGYVANKNPKAHNPCPAIWSDKEDINACLYVDAPILYNNYMLKLPASIDEAKEYYTNDLVKKAKKMLWRAGLCLRKVRSNGQMVIEVDDDGNPTERFINSVVGDMASRIADDVFAEMEGI